MHCSKSPHYYDEAPFHRGMHSRMHGGMHGGMNHRLLKFIFIFVCALATGLFYSSPVLAQDIKVTIDDNTGGTAPPTIYPQTGSAPFISCTGTPPNGEDCSSEDDFVRTLDTVTHRVNYSVNPAGTTANNVQITCTLTNTHGGDGQPFMQWVPSAVPPQCNNASSAISADGLTLTCDVGTVAGGQASNLKPTARVRGNAMQGQQIDMTCAIDADNEANPNSSDKTSNTVTNFVSAAPKIDLIKAASSSIYRRDVTHDYDGDGVQDPGLVYRYALLVVIGGGKGSEMITEDLVFTDTMTYYSGPNVGLPLPGAILESPGASVNPCGLNGDGGGANHGSYPYGRIGITGSAIADRSVTDSGTITCTQAGPGQPVHITISGADLSGSHIPPRNYSNYSVGSTAYVVSDYIGFWIPTEIIDAGNDGIPGNLDDGSLPVRNTYSAVDPDGISGQSSYGADTEPISNNTTAHTLYTFNGGMNKYYVRSSEPAPTYPHVSSYVAGQSYARSGDGQVMPGQTYASLVYHSSSGAFDLPQLNLCDKVDNITQFATQRTDMNYPPTSPAGNTNWLLNQAHSLDIRPTSLRNDIKLVAPNVYSIDDPNDGYAGITVTVMYGDGAPSDTAQYTNLQAYGGAHANTHWTDLNGDGHYFDEMRSTTCDAGDVKTGWYTDMAAVPGGPDAVTKVRFQISTLPPGVTVYNFTKLTARNTYPTGYVDPAGAALGGQQIPIGTMIPNYAARQTDIWSSGNWYITNWNAETQSGNCCGDVFHLTRAIVRIKKERYPDDSLNLIAPGQIVSFKLQPSVEVDPVITDPESARNVVITDTLPIYLEYLPGTFVYTNTFPGGLTPPQPTVLYNTPITDQTTLVWNLGDVDPVLKYDFVFDTRVRFNMPDGANVLNQSVIYSPDDVTDLDDRSADRGLTGFNASSISIFKDVPVTEMEINEPFTYTINYANTSPNDLTNIDFIDVLPFNGDGGNPTNRNPASSFSGVVELVNVTTPGGEQLYFTNVASASINVDPRDAANPADSSAGWCLPSEFGNAGCPTSMADVTAFRFTNPLLARNSPPRMITMVMQPIGNLEYDHYANNFTGVADGLLQVSSNIVEVKVIAGEIGDLVWEDLNANGIQDAGEPGIPNVQVELLDTTGGSVLTTTSTIASGTYTFTDLHSGDYAVKFSQPAGYELTLQDIGADDTLDSDIPLSTLETILINLGYNDNQPQWDAGFFRRVDLGDLVWFDNDSNGQQDGGEQGIPGITVVLEGLDGQGNTVLMTTTTDASGNYLFPDLIPGDYTVTFTPPYSLTFTTQDTGADGTDSDVNPLNGKTATITLISGQDDMTVDAGMVPVNFDLALEKKLGPSQSAFIEQGDLVTFALDVTNEGVVTATQIVVVDYVPSGFAYVPASNPSWTQAATTAPQTTIAGPLNPGATTTVNIILRADSTSAGSYVNDAEIAQAEDEHGNVVDDIDSDHDDNNNDPPAEDDHDDEPIFVIEPSVDLEKSTSSVDKSPDDADTGTGPEILIGSPVTWTYRIENTGNVTLTLSLSDNQINLSGATCIPTTISAALPPGDVTICTIAGVATTGQYENIGDISAVPTVGSTVPVTDTDPSHYFGLAPAIDLKKYTNGHDADSATGPYIPVGDTVVWTYFITNTGNTILNPVALTDDQLGTITCPQTTLNAGQNMTCTISGTATAGQYANIGEVQGTPVYSDGSTPAVDGSGNPPNPQEASDESHYYGSEPSIDIEKATAGPTQLPHDADTGTGPFIGLNAPVTWTYVITNTGNVPLDNVVITDTVEGSVAGLPASVGTYVSGDTNSNGILDPGEIWTYTLVGTASSSGQYSNDAEVSGDPVDNNGDPIVHSNGNPMSPETDDDPSHYYAAVPSIDLEKFTTVPAQSAQNADNAPGPAVGAGSTVTWTYIVTNTGNVILDSIVVGDNQGVTVTCPQNTLAVSASMICTGTGTATTGQYANTGDVAGRPVDNNGTPIPGPDGSPLPNVIDTDPSHYYGVDPDLTLEKSTAGYDADSAPGPYLSEGISVTWRYTATNTGNIDLANVNLNDSIEGTVSGPLSGDTGNDGVMAVGESWVYELIGTTISNTQYTNLGTVTGDPVDENGDPVPGPNGSPLPTEGETDPSHYFSAVPGLYIEKDTNTVDADTAPGPYIGQGGIATWTYVVINTGNVPLDNVTVTDDIEGTASSPSGDTDNDGWLDPTETWTYQLTTTVALIGQYDNLATVTGDPVDENGDPIPGPNDQPIPTLTDTDPSHYFGVEPGIDIEKHTAAPGQTSHDADSAPGVYIMAGDLVTWTYTVRNTGNAPMANVMVTDTVEGPISGPLSGDLNNNSLLDVTEVWVYELVRPANTVGQYSNIAQVSGTPADPNGNPVPGPNGAPLPPETDNDPSHYFGTVPGIQVEKDTNGEDADTGSGPYIGQGGTVTWTYVATNTGNVPLANVILTDDMEGVIAGPMSGDTDNDNMLDVSEIWTYQWVQSVATIGQYTNTADIVGAPATEVGNLILGDNGNPVDTVVDDDPSHYYGAEPDLALEKFTEGEDADVVPGPYLGEGISVTWRYTATNIGNVDLVNVTLDDNVEGTVNGPLSGDTNSDGLMSVGETWVYELIGTVTGYGQYGNIGTITGDPVDDHGDPIPGPNNQPVPPESEDDPSHYYSAVEGLEVEKSTNGLDADTGTGPYIGQGGTALWTYAVQNTGNVSLDNITLADDIEGAIAGPISGDTNSDGLLDPSETWVYQLTSIISHTGQYSNTATTTGDPVDDHGNPIPGPNNQPLPTQVDDDPSHYHGAVPGIDIEKHTIPAPGQPGQDADGLPGPYIGFDAPVAWTYIVQNTGNVPLDNIIVVDNVEGSIPGPFVGDTDGDGLLDINETWTFTLPETVDTAGQYTNTANVWGDPADEAGIPIPGPNGDPLPTETDEDTSHHYGSVPSITLEKSTNTIDGDSAPGVHISIGDPIIWTYVVHNDGNVPITNLVLTDDIEGVVGNPLTTSGQPPATNTLSPGETWVYEWTGTSTPGQYANTGTIVGDPVDLDGNPIPGLNGQPQPPVSADDPSHYYGVDASIVIEKSTTDSAGPAQDVSVDADTAPGPMININDAVTWHYVVTNPSNTALGNIAVADDQGVAVTCPQTQLAAGASMTCFANGTPTVGQYANIGSVVGDPVDAQGNPLTDGTGTPLPTVDDDDPSHYLGYEPLISIEKATNGPGQTPADADVVPGPAIEVGDLVTWNYVVTNDGTVPLVDVVVTDDQGIAVSCPQTTLAVGESITCTGTATATVGQYSNIGSVTGTPTDNDGNVIDEAEEDEDPSHYLGVISAIDIEKATNGADADTPTGMYIPTGNPLVWTYRVTNPGTLALSNVTVTDDQGVAVTPVPGSSPNLNSGDLNQDGLLDPNEVWIFEGLGTSAPGQYTNIGSVVGQPMLEDGTPFGPTTGADDPSHYFGSKPGIDIEKATNGLDSDLAPGAYLPMGTAVQWTYVVKNTGNTALADVVVTDNQGVAVTAIENASPGFNDGDVNQDSRLDINEVWLYTAPATTTVSGQYENIGSVTAVPLDANGNPTPDDPAQDSDPSHYYGTGPAIEIIKLAGDGNSNAADGTVYYVDTTGDVVYTFQVENIGNVPLSALVIVDDNGTPNDTGDDVTLTQNECPDLAGPLAAAPAGGVVTCTFTKNVTENETNTASVTGTPVDETGNPLPGIDPPTDADPADVVVPRPAITLDKSVYLGHDDGANCAGLPQISGVSGADITYCFLVTNTGDTYLDNVAVTDASIGVALTHNQPLQPGESVMLHSDSTLIDDLINIASTSGEPVTSDGDPLPADPPTDDGTAEVVKLEPAIALEKTVYEGHDSVNGQGGTSCAGADQLSTSVGAPLTYCFLVTNTGDTHLGNVTVTDPALNITLVHGQLLAPGESVMLHVETTSAGDLLNKATATGDPVAPNGDSLPAPPPSDEDEAEVTMGEPSLVVEKSTNQDDADSSPGPTILEGNDILWTYVVTNDGGLPINEIALTDDMEGMIQCPNTTLIPGESMVCTQAALAQVGPYANMATVQGTPVDPAPDAQPIPPISDDDPSHYVGEALPLGSIGDTVWLDANGDGIQDPGENGIPGVSVELVMPNGSVVTTVTDANGNYLFEDLGPGDYTVDIVAATLPLNTQQTFDDDGLGSPNSSSLTLGQGEDNLDQDFGYQSMGSIGDTLWLDIDGDGVQDPNEVGIPNATVTLTLPDGSTISTVTDGMGHYLFEDLPAGDYTITVDTSTLPAAVQQTYDADGLGSAHTSSLSLAGGEHNRAQDFGYQPVGAIGDTIWFDSDGDGVQDPGEDGIPGVTVELTLPDGSTVATVTDANGQYLFPGLSAGDYTVAVDPSTLPADVQQSYDADGLGSPDTSSVTLGPGETNLDQDFGYQPLGSIGDTIWLDADGDGIQGPGEDGIPGVAVELTLPDGSTVTAVTDANGQYLFDDLPSGYYTVDVDPTTLPPDLLQSFDADGLITPDSASLHLGPGEDNLDQDFGYMPAGAIGDTVWIDANGDGVQDPGENGIPDVIVELVMPDGTIVTTVTDADGNYLFEDLPPGDYTVNVVTATLPANLKQIYDADGMDTPDSSSLTLAAGEKNMDQDFGYLSGGSIGDTVWMDMDGDGIQSPNEPGIAGVTVELTMPDGTIVTAVTNGYGQYLFDGLPAGDYAVAVDPATLPPSWAQTYDGDGVGTPDGSNLTLGPGEDNRDQDFGYRPAGAIGDTIWMDTNGDGVQDPDENGISGVTVELTLPDGTIVTTVTDADGSYLFENLEPGDYTVTVDSTTLPPDVRQTFDDDGLGTPHSSSLTLGKRERNLDQDFGYQGPASIGDTIWLDSNGDGVQDPSESGIAGVTVELTLPDGSIISTVTDANGNYLFEKLEPGDYTVTVDTSTLSPGLQQTFDDDGLATPSSSSLTLGQGESNLGQDFGYRPPTGAIGDTIWYDTNGDGVQDPDESGVPGVTVELTLPDGSTMTTVTDANGNYLFEGLDPGDYTVSVDTSTLPAGITQTFDGDGLGSADSSSLTLEQGEINLDQDFGYQPELGAIGDTVWLDLDGDGVLDTNESGIPGVAVELTLPDGSTITTVTDADGNYRFDDLLPGDYTVAVDTSTLPEDVRQSYDSDGLGSPNRASLSLASGEQNMDQDFGYQPETGSIGDTIWYDINGDGVQNPGENGISGVTVVLTLPDGSIISTVTDADGKYIFDDLPPGDYTVDVDPSSLPDNMQPTADDDGLDSAHSASLTLDAGEQNMDQDFGYQAQSAAIGDRIWFDSDGDGVQDPGESGIAGVTIGLTLPDGSTIETVTDADGNYLFENLEPGDYVVQVNHSTLPEGVEQIFDADGTDSPNMSSLTLGEGERNLDQDFGYQAQFDLALEKSLAPDQNSVIHPGDDVHYVITVVNEGQTAAGSVTVYDYIPEGFKISENDNNGWSLVGPVLKAMKVVDGLSLQQGESIQLDIILTAGLDVSGDIENIAEIAGSQDERGLSLADVDSNADADATNDNGAEDDSDIASVMVEPFAAINSMVWFDENQDGIQDSSEPGIQGVAVSLYDGDGNLIGTTTTDSDGQYLFDELTAGDYRVEFNRAPGYLPSPMNTGDDGMGSNVDPETGLTPITTLRPGESSPGLSAGFYTSDDAVSLQDSVWYDANKDGIRDENETGVPGVLVKLFNADGELITEVRTDINGLYTLKNLPPGEYYLEYSPPEGYTGTINGVDSAVDSLSLRTPLFGLNIGMEDLNAMAGLQIDSEPLQIQSQAWFDVNKDGRIDGDEQGLAGVEVKLYDASGALLVTTMTDANGFYTFPNLVPGDYVVEFMPPNGYQASDLKGDNRVDPATLQAMVSLNILADGTTVDAGFISAPTSLRPTREPQTLFLTFLPVIK